MSIRYWFPADEELKGLSGVPVIDEDGGFVVGTMQCFARVALAGAVAANALAAQLPYADGWQVDERVVPAALLIDESQCIPRVAPAGAVTWAATALFDDDSDWVPAPTVTRDEDGAWTVRVPAPVAGAPRAVTDEDQYVTPFTFDDDAAAFSTVDAPAVARGAISLLWTDDGFAPPAASLGVDDDGLWRFITLTASPSVQALQADSEYAPAVAPSLSIDSDDGALLVLPSRPIAGVTAFADDDQYVGTLGTEDDGQWPMPLVAGARPVLAMADDSDFVVAPIAVALDDGPWTTPRMAASAIVQAFTDDDQFAPALASVTVEEEGCWPLVLSTPSRVLAITDDDQYVGSLGTDEDGWVPPVPRPIAIMRAITDDGDLIAASGTGTTAAEQYEWQQHVPSAPPRRVVAYAEQDDCAFGPVVLVLLPESPTSLTLSDSRRSVTFASRGNTITLADSRTSLTLA